MSSLTGVCYYDSVGWAAIDCMIDTGQWSIILVVVVAAVFALFIVIKFFDRGIL